MRARPRFYKVKSFARNARPILIEASPSILPFQPSGEFDPSLN
jgi:hypothetical protein